MLKKIYITFISIILFLIIIILFGIYFTNNEILFNAFFLHEFTSQLRYQSNHNVWFLTAPIISFLNSKFI
jgi:hypothetical protein